MRLRLASSEDHEFLATISDQIFNTVENKAFYNWSPESFRAELKIAQVLVLESGEQIVSFIAYRDQAEFIEIMALGTVPTGQKKSFQMALMGELQVIAARQRKPILLEVHSENIKAMGLYQKTGFILLNHRKKYYADGADALVMKWS